MDTLLLAIAALCQVTGSTSKPGSDATSYEAAEKRQLVCQQYYVNCYFGQDRLGRDFSKCVKERKL